MKPKSDSWFNISDVKTTMFFTAYNIAYLLSQALGVFAVYKFMKAFFEKRRVKKVTAVIALFYQWVLKGN